MKCEKCKNDFPEERLQSSHDVPKYMFFIDSWNNKNERSRLADQYPRHWLCLDCHNDYEKGFQLSCIALSKKFSSKFFKGKNGNSK